MVAPRLPPRPASPPAPSGLTEVLSKMTESLSTIQSQLASQATTHTQLASQVTTQAAANKSLEDKISKLQIQRDRSGSHSGNRDRPHNKSPDSNGQRSTTVCAYCGIPGHTADKCYKKERADKMTNKAPAHPPSAMHSPSAYLVDGEKDVKAVHYEGAFMALADHRTSTVPESDLP